MDVVIPSSLDRLELNTYDITVTEINFSLEQSHETVFSIHFCLCVKKNNKNLN
jgi:hypothetical protein